MKTQDDDLKSRPRNAYTRQDRRAAQREIEDALFALEADKGDVTFDSDALDALLGFAPDWML
jgi:hypothetical protein